MATQKAGPLLAPSPRRLPRAEDGRPPSPTLHSMPPASPPSKDFGLALLRGGLVHFQDKKFPSALAWSALTGLPGKNPKNPIRLPYYARAREAGRRWGRGAPLRCPIQRWRQGAEGPQPQAALKWNSGIGGAHKLIKDPPAPRNRRPTVKPQSGTPLWLPPSSTVTPACSQSAGRRNPYLKPYAPMPDAAPRRVIP